MLLCFTVLNHQCLSRLQMKSNLSAERNQLVKTGKRKTQLASISSIIKCFFCLFCFSVIITELISCFGNLCPPTCSHCVSSSGIGPAKQTHLESGQCGGICTHLQ